MKYQPFWVYFTYYNAQDQLCFDWVDWNRYGIPYNPRA